MAEILCAIDWASDHHDVALIDADGARLGRRRISDDATGLGKLATLFAAHGGGPGTVKCHDVEPAPVPSPDRLMHLEQQQKPINDDKTTHLAARHLQVFSTVGKPLPTSLDAGVPLRDVQEAASHADPRTTMRYDRAPSRTSNTAPRERLDGWARTLTTPGLEIILPSRSWFTRWLRA